MNIPITPLAELERERQRLLDELKEEGSDWAERYKPGSLGCHELLDRTALFAEMAEQCVVSHPACVLNPEWYSLAAQAVAILNDLYQRVGQEHLNDPGEQVRGPILVGPAGRGRGRRDDPPPVRPPAESSRGAVTGFDRSD